MSYSTGDMPAPKWGMGCEQCDQLWKLYQERRDIHLKLLKAARWGSQYLEEALERADGERQDARYQLLKHKQAHGQDGSWFSGPLTGKP